MEQAAFLRHRHVTEGQNQSGHRQRQHDQRIQQPAELSFSADDDNGGKDAKQQRHDDGEHCITQAVHDTWNGQAMAQRRLEMRRCQTRRQNRTIPCIADRQSEHAQMRQQAEQTNRPENENHWQRFDSSQMCRRRCTPSLRHHRIAVAPKAHFRNDIHQRGQHHHHQHQRIRHWIAADFVDARINLHSRATVEIEHQRRAQFRKCPNKHQ